MTICHTGYEFPKLKLTVLPILVALAARLAWVIVLPPRELRFDEVRYVDHARDLAAGKGYVDSRGRPAAFWPVGYPALLSVLYRTVGDRPSTNIALQLILGLATVGLTTIIGGAAFGPRIGRMSGLLLALYPNHISYTTLSLTEPLFAFLFVASAAALLKGGAATDASAGFLAGLAALARPVYLAFPIVLPVWYWTLKWPIRKIVTRTLLTGFFTLIAASPWMIRNHAVTGSWFTITTQGGYNFWVGSYPGSFGGYAFRREILELTRSGNVRDYSKGYGLGLAAIAASPVRALRVDLQKVTYFFALETDGMLWNFKGLAHPPPRPVTFLLLGAANAAYVLVLVFAILGLMRPRQPLARLFLILTGYLVLITTVFVGDPRYHYALIPLAVIFAAKGWIEDLPALHAAWKVDDPAARRTTLAWIGTVAFFGALMTANVVLKSLEAKAQVE